MIIAEGNYAQFSSLLTTAPFGSYRYYITAITLRLLVYAAANPFAVAASVSHIPFEADAAALVEHMGGAVGETLLPLHGARTVRQAFDPAQFLARLLAARTARTARTERTF